MEGGGEIPIYIGLHFMAASQAEQIFCSATSIARLSPNVDENKLGLSCRGLGVGGMDGLGGGIHIYIGLHFMAASQAEQIFCSATSIARLSPTSRTF